MVRGAGRDGEPVARPTRRGRPSCGAACASGSARPSPAERLADALRSASGPTRLVDLPPRLSLFGLTRLPAGHLDVLRALAAGRDVHLFLLHPSPALWERVPRGHPPVVRRADDPTAASPATRCSPPGARTPARCSSSSRRRRAWTTTTPSRRRADTLLGRIQADVRADRPPPGPPLPGAADERRCSPPATAASRSTPATAGPARSRSCATRSSTCSQDDPTLEPRDVIVMCPDIEAFAPLIHATFGAERRAPDRRRPAADLRVRLADRSLRQTNPVLGVVARAARAGRRPAHGRRRCSTSPAASPSAGASASTTTTSRGSQDWVDGAPASAGGSTPPTARRSGSTRSTANTWQAGLDRVLRRRDDGRGGRAAVRRASCRSTTSRAATIDLAGRARRAGRPPAGGASTALARAAARGGVGARRSPRPPTRSPRRPTPVLAAGRSCERLLDDMVARHAGDAPGLRARRAARPARRPAAGPADAGQLPHRPPDRLHAGADALGPAPGRLPARARRRRVPAPRRRATATTSLPADPHVGDRDPAARTASCCSTR